MSQVDFQIKIGVATQLEQLRAMESQFAKQIVQLRTLGTGGADALQKVEKNLGLVRSQLASIGGMDKAGAAVGDVFKSIPVVGTAMNMLNGSAAAVGGALAAAAYTANQFHASLQFADNLQDVSEQLGVSASNLQALNAHFGDAGIKAPQVAQTMQRLSLALAGAASGSQPLITAFSSLGLSVETLRGLAPDEALTRVGAALAAHAGSAEAAAAATAILGRGTGALLAALKELGIAGLEKTTSAMTAAGRVLDDAMVKKLADANQKLEELDQRWTIFKAGLVGIVIPGDPIIGPRGRAGSDALARANRSLAPTPLSALETIAAQPLKPVKSDAEIIRATQSSRRVSPALLEENRGQLRAESQANQLSNAPILAARAQLDALAANKKATLDAAEAAKALAEAKAPILVEQAKLDAQIDAAQIKQLDLATQLALAEDARHRVVMQMPAAEDQSVAAAKDRLALTTQLAAIDADIVVTKKAQAEADKVLADKASKAKEDALKRTASERDNALSSAIAASQLEISKIESNRLLDNIEKDAKRIPLLQAQNAEIQKRIDLLIKEDALNPDPTRQGKIDQLKEKQAGNTVAIGNSQPNQLSDGQVAAKDVMKDNDRGGSMGRGAIEGVSASVTQFGSDAAIVAGGIQASFQGAFEGISGSLQGLINGTMTWGDALRNISSTIMNSVIGAIADMFAKWLVGRAAQGIASMIWHTAETNTVIANESRALPVKAAGAVASGISSWGFAVLGGVAALALMASMGAFAEGGPVSGAGTGTSDSIPAWLSNGEYVMPADKTAQYRPLLDSMRDGTLNPGQLAAEPAAGGGSAVQSGSSTNIAIHAHYDQQSAVIAASRTSEFENIIVDMVSRNFHRISGIG